MSMGEDKIKGGVVKQDVPDGVPMAPASVSLMVNEYNDSGGITGGFFKRIR